ncbi:MAG: BatD family protein, partial [Anaerolineae bacterium]|nr:BatD family protein [Anaerolineae bacterium]
MGVFATHVQAQTPEMVAPDFFINAEVENANPYLGQQVTYVIRRYQAINFPNPPHYEEHPFTGFWHSPLIQRPTYTTTISGREYRVQSTYLALFPTLVGSLTIEPARLIIPGDGPEADTILESQSIDIQVRPLPPDRPPHYTGAVGQFEISAWFSPEVGQIDQPMNLIVELKGTGNIEGLTEPILPDLEHWVVGLFGSRIETNVPLSKDFIKGSRRFAWMVIPRQAGEQFFPAIRFSYFDPETARFESIRTEPLPVTILSTETGSTFRSPAPIPQQEILRRGTDIRHIKPVPDSLSSRPISIGPTFWAGVIIPIMAVGGVGLWHWTHLRRLDNRP